MVQSIRPGAAFNVLQKAVPALTGGTNPPRSRLYRALVAGLVGLLVGIALAIGLDLLWPRPATNPTYNQISGTTGGNFLRGIPMAWVIIGVPLLVGVIFYAFRYRRIHNHPLAIDAYDPEP